ncbi:MAG: hypothetical protein HKM24_06400, partial [Gammaproteobacteria bacterium]|nr:hypothetical protein [Gammaproteobacteria bacterium]
MFSWSRKIHRLFGHLNLRPSPEHRSNCGLAPDPTPSLRETQLDDEKVTAITHNLNIELQSRTNIEIGIAMKLPLLDTEQRYGKISLLNHWLLAILMIGMLTFGVILADMPKSPDKGALIGIHKSIGILILVLGLWRVIWRVKHRFPQPAALLKRWEKAASHA